MTEEELTNEYLGWKAYSRVNIPEVCHGLGNIIRQQKEQGGLVCVSSLSTKEIIERDFLHHFGILPDAVYDYDLPVDKRKPAAYSLLDIMKNFGLKPEEMLMVDDMKLGCMMAKSVGVPTAFAGWSKAEFPELTEEMHTICDFSFDSPAQLEAFLFKEEDI
jgi:phosphoglycolate phosphatase/pyrophosphatase PpaX